MKVTTRKCDAGNNNESHTVKLAKPVLVLTLLTGLIHANTHSSSSMSRAILIGQSYDALISIGFHSYLFSQDFDWPTRLHADMVVSPLLIWKALDSLQLWAGERKGNTSGRDIGLTDSWLAPPISNSPHVPAHFLQRSVLCLLPAFCHQQHKHRLATCR